jgi:hypothetical protein
MAGISFVDNNATSLKLKNGKFRVAQSYCRMCADSATAAFAGTAKRKRRCALFATTTMALVIAFIAVAVAQALQLLLTIVREREIKRLRKLVAEQSIFIKWWLTEEKVHSGQPRMIADGEPTADDTRVPEPAITPKDLPDTIPPRTTEEETARVMKVISWLNEAQSTQPQRMKPDGDQPMADLPAPAIPPKDLHDRARLT